MNSSGFNYPFSKNTLSFGGYDNNYYLHEEEHYIDDFFGNWGVKFVYFVLHWK